MQVLIIFNLLPVWLRNLDGVTVDQFKGELDKFLSLVPDEPTIPGRGRAATTNSFLDQLQLQVLASYIFTGWQQLLKSQQL